MTTVFLPLYAKEQDKGRNIFEKLVILYKAKAFSILNLPRREKLIKMHNSRPVQ